MKTQFTPGKWSYVRSGYGSKNADFDIVNSLGGRIASTPYEDKARLIATVPDLLAACQAVIASVDSGERTNSISLVRAAIAKATQS